MSETKLPECHFCHQEIAEGNKVKTRITERTLYICFDCTDIIADVAHDFAGVFNDIASMMNNVTETWKERLEPWSIQEG